jgi:hypothetical protein
LNGPCGPSLVDGTAPSEFASDRCSGADRSDRPRSPSGTRASRRDRHESSVARCGDLWTLGGESRRFRLRTRQQARGDQSKGRGAVENDPTRLLQAPIFDGALHRLKESATSRTPKTSPLLVTVRPCREAHAGPDRRGGRRGRAHAPAVASARSADGGGTAADQARGGAGRQGVVEASDP